MGWISYPAKHYKNGKIDRLAEVRALLDSDKVLKDAMVGSTYYAAAKGNNGKVFGLVVLTFTENNREFGYKDISSDMGPVQCDCPESILKLITADDEETVAWVKRCKENAERKKKSLSLKSANAVKVKLPFDTNHFSKGKEVLLEHVTKNSCGGKCNFWKVHNMNLKMARNVMNLLFTEFPDNVEVLG